MISASKGYTVAVAGPLLLPNGAAYALYAASEMGSDQDPAVMGTTQYDQQEQIPGAFETLTELMERHEKWEPVTGIATAAARAVVSEDHEGLVVTMIFSEIAGDETDSNLRIKFGRVAAYTVYEEFVHPWDSPEAESPMIGEGSRRCVFPLLLIHDSEWTRSLSDRLLGFPDCVHYRLLTLDEIVDVLSNKQPEVTWVKEAKS